jgi:hypothetical protein
MIPIASVLFSETVNNYNARGARMASARALPTGQTHEKCHIATPHSKRLYGVSDMNIAADKTPFGAVKNFSQHKYLWG